MAIIGGTVFAGWYVMREHSEPPPSRESADWESAVWATDRWDQMELLDVDSDGSLLVAFYDGGRSIDYQPVGGKEVFVVTAEQQPGIAVFTADGKEHVLQEPRSLNADAVGEAVGSIHKGSIAVAWQVREGGVDADGELALLNPTPTVAMAIGTVEGLTPMPTPVLDGRPLSVHWGGLHVADGALVALVADESLDFTEQLMTGLVDPASGTFTVVDKEAGLAPMRDLCDPTGSTFGYVAVGDNGGSVSIHQFSVTQGEASEVRNLVPPEPINDSIPFNACGDDFATVDRTSQALMWTEGSGALSTSPVGHPIGDVFLAPEWAAVFGYNFEDDEQRVLIVDRATGVSHFVSDNCERLVVAGDWVAFGYPDGDTCLPVAVRASELLAP